MYEKKKAARGSYHHNHNQDIDDISIFACRDKTVKKMKEMTFTIAIGFLYLRSTSFIHFITKTGSMIGLIGLRKFNPNV